MRHGNGAGLDTATPVTEARKTGGEESAGRFSKPNHHSSQINGVNDAHVHVSELTGVNTIVTLGAATVSKTPVLTLCAKLVAAGIDPTTPLTVYRGSMTLTVRSIGINGKGSASRSAQPRWCEKRAWPVLREGPVLSPSVQTGRHAFVDRGQDLYETPPGAVEALLKAETLPHPIWEPAAGRGAIANVLRARGLEVVASDIDCGGAELNFYAFSLLAIPAGFETIRTNPPYRCADALVQHALDWRHKSTCYCGSPSRKVPAARTSWSGADSPARTPHRSCLP
jgi:hypothetical protein